MGRDKKTDSMDDLVQELSKDRVNNTFPTHPLDVAGRGEISDDEQIADLFANVPKDEGYYLKLYKKFPVPREYGNRPVFLCDIQQPELIVDLESEVLKMARQNSWGDGIFEAKLFKKGLGAAQAQRRITIQLPIAPITPTGSTDFSSPPPDPLAPLQMAVRLLKEISPNTPNTPNPGADPAAIVKAVSDSYRAGVDAAGRGQQNLDLPAILKLIRELNPPVPAPARDNTDLIVTLLKELKQPAVDPFETILKLKSLITPPTQEDNTTKAIDLVNAIVPLAERLGGGGGNGEPTSATVELIRVIGPQIGKIVEDVTSTVNNVINTKTNRPTNALRKPMMKIEQPQPQTESQALPTLPIFDVIKKAVDSSDTNFYPQLDELIMKVMTEEQYNQLISGQLPPKQVLDQVTQWGGPFLQTNQALVYFESFISWLKQRKASEIVAFCEKCNTEFIFDNQEDLKNDPNCHQCNIKLSISNLEPAQG